MNDYRLLGSLEQKPIDSLSDRELGQLCDELRRFLIENVSKTGGHLASNLGIVEISVALQLCFNPEKDRIVYDVGHQCYVHKILNGRRDLFDTLRKFRGISGFIRPSESPCDAFLSGHSSTSISAALGFARAMRLKNEKSFAVAVIGDGALTGGLAYEALNDAGSSGEPLIVILNDNGMSITKNVGALATYFSHLRIRGSYLKFKRFYHKIFDGSGLLRPVDRFLRSIKNAFKRFIMPANFFDDMGFAYYGPYDGHDLPNLRYQFEAAKRMGRPVLLHLKTIKGRGYAPAEKSPNSYHGVSPFDPESGLGDHNGRRDFAVSAGEYLCSLAEKDERICAITAAMPYSTGLVPFSRKFKKRFFDVGIAEGHAVTMAAGLAAGGMIPVFAVYSTFLQRGYDQLIHDASIQKQHIVLLIDRAGLVGEDGETHHGTLDIGFLTQIPGMTVFSPVDEASLKESIYRAIYECDGPVAVRYPKVSSVDSGEEGAGNYSILREGSVLTVVSYGRVAQNALDALSRLDGSGLSAQFIRLNKIWPLEAGPIVESVRETGRLTVIEETNSAGCIGEHILSALAREGVSCESLLINLGDGFIPQGDVDSLLELCGLTDEGIFQRISDFLVSDDETRPVRKLKS